MRTKQKPLPENELKRVGDLVDGAEDMHDKLFDPFLRIHPENCTATDIMKLQGSIRVLKQGHKSILKGMRRALDGIGDICDRIREREREVDRASRKSHEQTTAVAVFFMFGMFVLAVIFLIAIIAKVWS